MIVVQRKTGVILYDDPITEEQRTLLWEKFLEVAAPPLIKKMMETPDLDIGGYPLDENAHSGE